MVLASFVLFITLVVNIGNSSISIAEREVVDSKIAIGTFSLLEKSIAGKSPSQIELLISTYKKKFGPDFSLLDQKEYSFTKDELTKLEKYKVLFRKESPTITVGITIKGNEKEKDNEEDLAILYYKSKSSSLVWRIHLDLNLDISINESGLTSVFIPNKFGDGLFYLIQSEIAQTQKINLENKILSLESTLGLPLSIKEASTLDLTKHINLVRNTKEKVALLKKGEIINYTEGTKFRTFIQNIPNSTQYLQIGPIETPWLIRNTLYLFLLSFIVSFASTVILWLWPLWSNLRQLKRAATEFGEGKYDTRLPIRTFSPIKKVTSAFNAMAEQTQQSIRAQKELTSAVSHELRTPVARMRFALEMLEGSKNKKDSGRYIEAINADINELDLLLEELLSYARFDQKNPNINLKNTNWAIWLDDSMERLLPLADKIELSYKTEYITKNDSSHFEPRLLSRVLDNLVQNALRYANHQVLVTLSKDADHYILNVEDDGDGIPKDKHDQIFEAFSRIDASRDRASGGFGLGLAIVNRIIKAHKGEIIVGDSVIGGAHFEIRIPYD